MRIIITGGTGLIGTPLVKTLSAGGHEIIVLSRNPGKYSFPEGVLGVPWDGHTSAGWGQYADGADAIVNLAGESIGGSRFPPPRWTEARKQRIVQSRIAAGEAVVGAVIEAKVKPKVVLQSSGIDYYGNVPGDQEITEKSGRGSGFLSDLTEKWEASTTAVTENGVRQIILRTGIILSLDGGALPQTALPFKFFVGGPLGSGRQWWPWIHLQDEVRAIQFLLEKEDATGVYNLCAPNPLPQKSISKVLGRVMGRPSFIPAPSFALQLMLGEMSAIVLDGRRAVPKRLAAAGFRFKFPEVDEALLDLYNK